VTGLIRGGLHGAYLQKALTGTGVQLIGRDF
jgi:hypothetical protein